MTNDNKHNRPDLLVETEWLAEHLDDPNLRIVDMGPIDAYKRGHIPGSMGLNRDYFKDPDNRVLVMGPDQFAKAMGEVGIGDEHDVIAYDDWGGLYAGRLWWLLRMHGHEKVRVLNGGWNKWMSEGRPVEAVPLSLYHSGKPMSPHAPATFTSNVLSEYNCTLDQLKEGLNQPEWVTLDVRTDAEYTGALTRGNKRGGHIPDTIHIEWTKAVTDDEFRTFLPPAELRQLYESAGITPEKKVVTY